MIKLPLHKVQKGQNQLETDISREIKLLAEVEKIWILYDLDKNGKLDIKEIKDYINTMAVPSLVLSDSELTSVFNKIDTDGDGYIDKKEMESFLKVMMFLQQNLHFRPSDVYLKREQEKRLKLEREKQEEAKRKYQQKIMDKGQAVNVTQP